MEIASPILDDAEVSKRKILLAELAAALDRLGIRCVLAGRRRLVLRFSDPPPLLSSGLTDPSLHVLGAARAVVTTDGDSYRLGNGREFPVCEATAAAASICKLSPR